MSTDYSGMDEVLDDIERSEALDLDAGPSVSPCSVERPVRLTSFQAGKRSWTGPCRGCR